MKTPKQVLTEWVAAFNDRNAVAVAKLYHEDATNLQVAVGTPLNGKKEILADAEAFFRAFPDSYTHIENLFEDGEWAILEWSGGATFRGPFAGHEPNGKTFKLRGCGFFHIAQGRIKFQRGYWDKATWLFQLGLPLTHRQ